MGSMLPKVCCSSGIARYSESDVEETHVFGVRLDETAACVDVVAHERREDLVCDRGVFDRALQQRAGGRVHRRVAELLPVHLAETLEPAHLDLATLVLGLER